ncbi:BZ3500_MvSof-1268-A1-R1_Chr3-3g06461 [Microbotryum saponariae]|uniref:BZ3500_MvSof-1268-A1-R1_Chr3-3g06461 protein n=1 Tax=Microbotryum saponariae TaxID=289078 RepID=A0A2X0LHD7_9BASI|nr:BZ3500_MvSof-1268-A1-R1_Chr3-3g06461 [Microbotryum saponariae]SDA04428.1 BZ3501_MvSof-1269-A2-R1_Chr3-2g06148 [Microbotryum saponariae]
MLALSSSRRLTQLVSPTSVLLRQSASAVPGFISCRRRGMASTSPTMAAAPQINTITVFGAGLMGSGIIQVAAQNGVKAIMTDVSDAALDNGKKIITKSLQRIARKKFPDSTEEQQKLIDDVFANITTTTDAATAVKKTDFVVEAIVENLKVKQELFRRLDDLAPAATIFASNTSSLSIEKIAETCSLKRKERFAGFHAFNPVPQMKLVEIVQTSQTSDEVRDSLLDLCKRMKKTPVNCKDNPGRAQSAYLLPSRTRQLTPTIRMVERGDATAEDVDTAMKLGAGLPMGPIELSDFVGLDTLSNISKGWHEDRVSTGEIEAKQVEEIDLLDKLVKEGKTGRKSGEGFYKCESLIPTLMSSLAI